MRRLILLSCLFFFFLTCTDEFKNPVPSWRVYLEVDLSFRDKTLLPLLSYKIFNSKNTVPGKEHTGYGGVIVTLTTFGEYKAFDITCPNEVRKDAIIEIDEEYNAVCKVCGSKFEVMAVYGSGGCINGKTKYPLRPYSIPFKDNNTLIVRN